MARADGRGLTRAELRARFEDASVPVLLGGLVSSWRATTAWRPERLAARYAGRRFDVGREGAASVTIADIVYGGKGGGGEGGGGESSGDESGGGGGDGGGGGGGGGTHAVAAEGRAAAEDRCVREAAVLEELRQVRLQRVGGRHDGPYGVILKSFVLRVRPRDPRRRLAFLDTPW